MGVKSKPSFPRGGMAGMDRTRDGTQLSLQRRCHTSLAFSHAGIRPQQPISEHKHSFTAAYKWVFIFLIYVLFINAYISVFDAPLTRRCVPPLQQVQTAHFPLDLRKLLICANQFETVLQEHLHAALVAGKSGDPHVAYAHPRDSPLVQHRTNSVGHDALTVMRRGEEV